MKKFHLGRGYYFAVSPTAQRAPPPARPRPVSVSLPLAAFVHYLLLSNFQPLETTFPAGGEGKGGMGKKTLLGPYSIGKKEFSGLKHIETKSEPN